MVHLPALAVELIDHHLHEGEDRRRSPLPLVCTAWRLALQLKPGRWQEVGWAGGS